MMQVPHLSQPMPHISFCGRVTLLLLTLWLCACGQPQDLPSTDSSPTLILDQPTTGRTHPTPTPRLPDAAYWLGEKEEEARYIEDLKDPHLEPEVRRSLEEKLDMLRRAVAEQATALAMPPVDKSGPEGARPTDLPEHLLPQPPLGIIESTEDPLEWGLIVKNRWQEWYEKENRVLLQAFVGADQDDPRQGVVLVSTLTATNPRGGYYPTPRKVGPVRIIAEQDHRLTLQADDGSLFVFDLTTRQYLDPPVPATSTPPANE